jgi:hypothetical protein
MEMHRSADDVRVVVAKRYVKPFLSAGTAAFSIRVRDVLSDLAKEGFPRGRTPLVCEVLQGKKFLQENGLEIESVEGPPSKQSSTVVVHYRVRQSGNRPGQEHDSPPVESSEAWAKRLTDKLSGLLKDELAAYGGGEAFLKWVRSEDDENAA